MLLDEGGREESWDRASPAAGGRVWWVGGEANVTWTVSGSCVLESLDEDGQEKKNHGTDMAFPAVEDRGWM